MKIAIVIDGLARGGAERQAIMSTFALRQRGVGVDLVVYHDEIAYVPLMENFGVNPKLIESGRIRRVAQLANLFKDENYDIVHAFKGTATLNACIPIIISGPRVFIAGYRGAAKPSAIRRAIYQVINRRVDGWIVNSHAVKELVTSCFGASDRNVNVVPNGVWPNEFHSSLSTQDARRSLGISPHKRTIAIIGSLRSEKNHDFFLRVAARVLKVESGRVQFIIAGDGPLRPVLWAYASELGISEYVLFLGDCDRIADLLRATDLVSLSSKTEGMPNVLIEAGVAGIPCISTDNGGASYIIDDGKNGFIVPFCEQTMADRIVQLLTNDAMRIEFGRCAQYLATSRFSLDALGENLERVYCETLAAKQ